MAYNPDATDWESGMLFRKYAPNRPNDPMAVYRFDGWADVPESSIAGRVADATWPYNGTRSSAWERDMFGYCPSCGCDYSDPTEGCDDCWYFTVAASGEPIR